MPVVRGTPVRDIIDHSLTVAGEGFDIWADGGDDIVGGSDPADTIHAGSGNDYVHGFGGDDFVDGEFGDDELLGGRGNDLLSGGEGNDVPLGGFGADRLYGGAGDAVPRASPLGHLPIPVPDVPAGFVDPDGGKRDARTDYAIVDLRGIADDLLTPSHFIV